MTLASMGGPARVERQPWIPIALAAKLSFDVAQAGKLTVDRWTKHRAFRFSCLVAAGATFATLPLVLPEARAALGRLIG